VDQSEPVSVGHAHISPHRGDREHRRRRSCRRARHRPQPRGPRRWPAPGLRSAARSRCLHDPRQGACRSPAGEEYAVHRSRRRGPGAAPCKPAMFRTDPVSESLTPFAARRSERRPVPASRRRLSCRDVSATRATPC
jgi:hypothetical protein